LSQKLGRTSAQNWEEVAPDFDSRFEGIEATAYLVIFGVSRTVNASKVFGTLYEL